MKERLADLRAAKTTNDLIVGSARKVWRDDVECMMVQLSQGYTMVFRANHPRPPLTTSGELDWSKVTRVQIVAVERNNA